MCDHEVSNDDPCIQCELCESWFCFECIGMSEAFYNELVSSSHGDNVIWYDFKVRYLPGPQMPADILSRAPLADSDFTACNLSDKHINYVTINSLPVAVTLDELQKASESDPIISKVRTCVLSNKWIKGEELKNLIIRLEMSCLLRI